MDPIKEYFKELDLQKGINEPYERYWTQRESKVRSARRKLPVITRQPQSISLEYPEAGVLSVEADSLLPLTYQWYYNGILVPNETSVSIEVNLGGIYTVVVSNSAGSVTSQPATVDCCTFGSSLAQYGFAKQIEWRPDGSSAAANCPGVLDVDDEGNVIRIPRNGFNPNYISVIYLGVSVTAADSTTISPTQSCLLHHNGKYIVRSDNSETASVITADTVTKGDPLAVWVVANIAWGSYYLVGRVDHHQWNWGTEGQCLTFSHDNNNVTLETRTQAEGGVFSNSYLYFSGGYFAPSGYNYPVPNWFD